MLVQALEGGTNPAKPPVCLQSLICHLDRTLHPASTSKCKGRRVFSLKNFKAKLSGMKQLLQTKPSPAPGAGSHNCLHTQPWLTHPS